MTKLDILQMIYDHCIASEQASAECDKARKELANALECVQDFNSYNRIDAAAEEVIYINGFDYFVKGYEMALSLHQTNRKGE